MRDNLLGEISVAFIVTVNKILRFLLHEEDT